MDWKKYLGPLVLISITIIFIVVLLIMGAGNLFIGDDQLFMALNPPFNPADPTFFDYFFVHYSTWGPGAFGLGIWGCLLFLGILLGLSLKNETFKPCRFLVLVVAVSFLVGYLGITIVTKSIIFRERPFMDIALSSSVNDWFPFFYPSGSILEMFDLGLESFPSGHATTGFIFATPFVLIFKNYLIKIAAIGYGIITGYARIYIGVHYPADVFVGSLVGILTVCLFYVLFKKYLIPRVPWFEYENIEK